MTTLDSNKLNIVLVIPREDKTESDIKKEIKKLKSSIISMFGNDIIIHDLFNNKKVKNNSFSLSKIIEELESIFNNAPCVVYFGKNWKAFFRYRIIYDICKEYLEDDVLIGNL
ncbi:MAG: hypothetical protein LBD57_04455 [Endomicrobium sp.]|uniref:hypothetical protein n=1 Tax=Candidatus Endomicrobiellum cubanum TaxID=3242325 RepID=UPI0028312E26|nr:hypothetical protein [Endomicrobium sp.]